MRHGDIACVEGVLRLWRKLRESVRDVDRFFARVLPWRVVEEICRHFWRHSLVEVTGFVVLTSNPFDRLYLYVTYSIMPSSAGPGTASV
jgi:hypothetical protein